MGLTRRRLTIALASLSPLPFLASDFFWAITLFLTLFCLFVRTAMRDKNARRSEFAELVAYHIFGHQNRNKLFAVIDAKRDANELRQYGRAAGPYLNNLITSACSRLIRFGKQISVDKRA